MSRRGEGGHRERYGPPMKMPTEKLRSVKVLVTGATGFVGGALALRLARDEGAVGDRSHKPVSVNSGRVPTAPPGFHIS